MLLPPAGDGSALKSEASTYGHQGERVYEGLVASCLHSLQDAAEGRE